MASDDRRSLRPRDLARVEPRRAVRELRSRVVGQYKSLQGSQLRPHTTRVPGIPNDVQKAHSHAGANYRSQSFGGDCMALVCFQTGAAHALRFGTAAD